MTEAPTDSESIKAHCNNCLGMTNHTVLHRYIASWSDDVVSGGDEYCLIKCAGCDVVHLKHDNWFSEDYDPETGPNITTVYYPPAISRRRPTWLRDPLGPFILATQKLRNYWKKFTLPCKTTLAVSLSWA
jgi:hypothetical protein